MSAIANAHVTLASSSALNSPTRHSAILANAKNKCASAIIPHVLRIHIHIQVCIRIRIHICCHIHIHIRIRIG